jgi:hypothetical protein
VGDTSVVLHEATGPTAEFALHDAVAIPAPAAFKAKGIGGILSPQRLHSSAFAIIDEIDDELLLLDADAMVIRRALLARHPGLGVFVLDRRPGDNRPIVDAAVEPHPALPVLVNTGGRHTEFEPASVPGLAGGALERIGVGVSGADVLGASAGSQILRIGGGRVALPSVMLRAGMVDPAGMLGQDVLRGTVVVVGPDSATSVLWQVAELGAGRSEPSATV